MCGIAGLMVFENDSFQISENFLNTMRDTMIHRGPDGCGSWISEDNKIGLAHRRLSIVDLSPSAAQPMSNENSSVVISFNGEIYNHAEIKAEIQQQRQFQWKTDHSDTEVILRAYETWGIEFIYKLRGMFGLAIWDNSLEKLFLIRDRMGIKPVYYSIHDSRITFASEIKALLTDPQQKREVNETALYNYLSFLTTPAPNTLFAGIKKLEAGTYLEIAKNGEYKTTRWYDVWDNVKKIDTTNEQEIFKRVREKLEESVKIRKMADVPVGVFLSGGIDSSTNAAMFSENGKKKIKTFSIGYEGEYESYKNELDYAKLMADKVGAEYHERLLNIDDLLDFIPEMVHLQDEPIADPVCVPVYYVSKLARDNGVTVCQVGEGADELFLGYPTWELKRKLQIASDIPGTKLIQKTLAKLVSLHPKHKNRWEYEALRRSIQNQPVFWGGAESFSEGMKENILSKRMNEKFKDYTSWEALKPIWQRYQDKAWEKSNLHWMTYLDLNYRLPELLLMRVDKMSMGVSLEGRVPFLDHEFVELALSIPEKIKTKKCLKHVLKEAVTGIIPDELIHRKKQGFGVPVYEWVFGKLGDEIHKELKSFCEKTDYFDWKEVEKLVNNNAGAQVWYLYNLAKWWSIYINV